MCRDGVRAMSAEVVPLPARSALSSASSRGRSCSGDLPPDATSVSRAGPQHADTHASLRRARKKTPTAHICAVRSDSMKATESADHGAPGNGQRGGPPLQGSRGPTFARGGAQGPPGINDGAELAGGARLAQHNRGVTRGWCGAQPLVAHVCHAHTHRHVVAYIAQTPSIESTHAELHAHTAMCKAAGAHNNMSAKLVRKARPCVPPVSAALGGEFSSSTVRSPHCRGQRPVTPADVSPLATPRRRRRHSARPGRANRAGEVPGAA